MGQIPNFCRACGEKLDSLERVFCGRAPCQDRARQGALAPYSRLEGGAPDTLGAMPKSRMLELLRADQDALGPKVHFGPRSVVVHAKLTLLIEEVKRHRWDDCACFLADRAEIQELRVSPRQLSSVETDGLREAEVVAKRARARVLAAMGDYDIDALITPENCPNHPRASTLEDVWCSRCGADKSSGKPRLMPLTQTPENCPNHPPASTLRDVSCRDCGVDKRRGVLMDPGPIRLAHSSGRDIACKFGPVPVEPLSNGALQLMPQMALRASRFIVNEEIASYFGLLYLRVGMDSVLGNLDESMMIPARAFTPDAIGIGFRLEACPGQLVSLVVRNCTHERHMFSAMLLGTRG